MTPALTATPEPTSEPTMAATSLPVPTEPAGARLNWPADVQAREKAVLFALAESPWPSHLWPEVLRVSYCESTWRPDAENGISYGLLQLTPLWFGYYGVPFESWADINVNLALAWQVYQYDLSRGQAPWTQWQCKPG